MELNSIAFFVFLLITFIIYWSTPAKLRWGVLLLSGYVFYISWDWRYALLLFSVTLVAYVSGILLERFKSRNKIRKTILNIALLLCLGSLFVFKYFNFFSLSFKNFLARFSINVDSITLKLLLPIGISFYTFQAVGYIIDVYREDFKAEYHFGKFAAFMSFFPQLLSGPIARSESLLPQIKEYHQFDYERATYGIKRIVIGTFKKFVIADYLGGFINPVFATPESYNGFAYLLSIFLFSIQIYCDFAGYSDIAIGLARLFDIDLIENFKTPYFASSIKEFWGRWHISLSTWLRDYVYIPLGGNRVGKLRHSFNLMVTFLISGLWHGSNWTFVVWGGVPRCFTNYRKYFIW